MVVSGSEGCSIGRISSRPFVNFSCRRGAAHATIARAIRAGSTFSRTWRNLVDAPVSDAGALRMWVRPPPSAPAPRSSHRPGGGTWQTPLPQKQFLLPVRIRPGAPTSRALSSAGERLFYKQDVGRSIRSARTNLASVAQREQRCRDMAEVGGSIPSGRTTSTHVSPTGEGLA